MILEYNATDDDNDSNGLYSGEDTDKDSSDSNLGTLIFDASCAPHNIEFT